MGLNDLSDEKLMMMYQTGNEDAFQILYRRHSEKVYGFLRSRVWNDEKAAELFQDTFLKMHRSKHLYNQSLPALPWIFSITKSVLNDGLRRQKKSERDKDFSFHQEGDDRMDRQLSEVTPLIAHLSEDRRRAIQLRNVDKKTFEKIATALETSPSNVRKIVSRAVKKLKALAVKGE